MLKRSCAVALLLAVPFLTICASMAQERGPADRDYTAIVTRCLETLIEKGTNRYGRVQSPLFAAALDLGTLSTPTESPIIPPGPKIRESDRCWKGCNPYLDTETIRAMYELTRRTGNRRYREAAERYLSYFLEHCPSPATGLLPWGEHTFWNLTTDAVERDNHEFLVWLPLWPEMWDLDAPVVRRAIEGIYAHHVFDKKTGMFNRHASYSDARKVLGTKSGMPWIKHAALQAYSLAFLYGKTGEPIYLERALQMANLYWKTRDPESGLPIACIGHSENPGSGGIAQCEALLAASAVSGRNEFRDMAVAYLSAAAKRTPNDPKATPKVSWAVGYGSDGGVFREAQYMLHGYQATGDPDMLRTCEYYARVIAANPPTDQAPAEAYGRAIRFLTGLARTTGKTEYMGQARALADAAIEKLYHEPSGLFRGMVGYECYDAQFGIGDLLMGLLDLDEHPYDRSRDDLGVELDRPQVPPDAADWSMRFSLVNSARHPISGRVRIGLPNGWRAAPTMMDFTAPAATPAGDVWLVDSGRADLEARITAPAGAGSGAVPVAFHVDDGSPHPTWEKTITLSLGVLGEGCLLKGPFLPDPHTVALAHFDKSVDADSLNAATWDATEVSIVPDGFFGGGASLPGDKSRICLTFPQEVPKDGTVEFFIKPNWTSTRDKSPASDGVVRHIFAWAPMTEKSMLWVYFLDELGAYTGARVHVPHGKPYLSRTMDFKEGEWHHLALCWETQPDGRLSFAYFVDGAPCREGLLAMAGLPPAVKFQQELNIGSYPGCPARGIIDEVRISSVARYERGLIVVGLDKANAK